MAGELIQAIEAGDAERVQALLDERPECARERDDDGVPAVLVACYRGHSTVAGRIAAAKGELDVFEAAALGRTDRVRELLDASPQLAHEWTQDGFTALHYAAFFGDPETAKLLIERGADINAIARHPHLVVAPLHSAAAARQLETVRALLDAGADPNARQENGFVALHAAAQHGDRAMTELLLERGADAAAATDDGRTALSIAEQEGHEELAALLRERA